MAGGVLYAEKFNYNNRTTVWKRRTEIGEKLAKKLGIKFYDKELIKLIAKTKRTV